MMRRTAAGKAKNGMTSLQARRQLWPMAGYLRPQGPASKASSAASPASASLRPVDARSAGDGLAILPGDEVQGVAEQMNDAGLDHRVWGRRR